MPAIAQATDAERHFESLVRDHSADLFRLAVRLTGQQAEAEDVVQRAFLRALEAIRRGAFRGDSEARTWLYRIVLNVVFDERRRASRFERFRAQPQARVVSAESVEAGAVLRELRQSLEALPDDQRTALVLKELHGLSGRQTAEVMSRSEASIEQLLVRARISLRARFDHD